MKRAAFYIILIFFQIISLKSQVVINELMAYNTSTIWNSELSIYSDWIEIYNNSSESYDLSYCCLSDELDEPGKWKFPAGTAIGPGKYMIIWADNPLEPLSGLHASFKLNVAGESLILSNLGTGQILDSLTFGRQTENISYGKNSQGEHVYFSNPTPVFENDSESGFVIASGIRFDPPPGIYTGSQQVELSWKQPGATIRYTLDSSEPDESSSLYTGPVNISNSTVIRAKIWADGYEPGWIETGTYIIGQTFSLPVFSLATDPPNLWDDYTGIYVEGKNGITGYCSDLPMNFNQDWERPVSMEYFDLSGKRILNLDGGVKIFGGCSRGSEMKSLAFYARNQYGANEIRYPFFREKPHIDWFKDIVFRNSGNDFQYTLMRDGVMQAVVKGQMDIDAQAFEPVHVFLNGEYWGIYNLREKLNEYWAYSNYGFLPEQIDFIKNRYEVFSGTNNDYNDLYNFLNSNSLSLQENYNWVAERMDVNEYMNYLMVQMFFANDDWPGNNLKYWRPYTDNGKWRWIIYDLDFGMGLYGGNPAQDMFSFSTDDNGPSWPNPPWSTRLIRRLFENEDFRNEFIRRYMMHLNTTFHEDRVIEVIDSIYGMVVSDFPLHINRWGQPWSIDQWNNNVEQLRDYALMRPENVWENMGRFFGLGEVISLNIENTSESGNIRINGFDIPPEGISGRFYEGYPLELEALPKQGKTFDHWEIYSGEDIKEILLPVGSFWKYFDKGYSPGSGWNQPGFNDNSWDEGYAEFGYGDDNETTILDYGPDPGNKYTTYYFRTRIGIAELPDLTSFNINLMRDDGAVVYVNGDEVLRANMPEGAVEYETFAITYVGGEDENTYYKYHLESLPLQAGHNYIAVEIHQSSPESSDISFDMEIIGEKFIPGESISLEGSRLTYEPTAGMNITPVFKASETLPELIINEFMASNQKAYPDEAGEYEDWIEIFNAGDEVVNLAGSYITDDLLDPFKWKIQAGSPGRTTIHPGEYLVLFADEDTLQGANHLNFRLSSTGEEIGLATIFQDEFTWIDQVTFGSQTTDQSAGRYPDGAPDWNRMAQFTPGESNLINSIPQLVRENLYINLYPNPAVDFVTLEVKGFNPVEPESNFEIKLYDLAGRIIMNRYYVVQETGFDLTLELSDIPAGFYILVAGSGEQIAQLQLIRQ